MPFGLVNAAVSFSRIMRKLLDGLNGALNYIDDILLFSTTWEQHLKTLTELFVRLRAANLTARPRKCYIGHNSVEFLGHVVGQGEVAPRPEKVKAIQEITQPKTRSSWGLFLERRTTIVNSSPITLSLLPLTDKTKKNEPNVILWEARQENAFKTLKAKPANPPILRPPNWCLWHWVRSSSSTKTWRRKVPRCLLK